MYIYLPQITQYEFTLLKEGQIYLDGLKLLIKKEIFRNVVICVCNNCVLYRYNIYVFDTSMYPLK